MIMGKKAIIGIIMVSIGIAVITYGAIWALKKKALLGVIVLLAGVATITYNAVWLGKTINMRVPRTKTKKQSYIPSKG
mgnify:FL=1|jgi:hypothetical protein